MRYNLVAKREYPPEPHDCELACIDVDMVPFYLGALWLRSQKYWWSDEGTSQQDARWALNRQMGDLLMPCGQDVVNAIDRVYTLLDRALYARVRTYTPAVDGLPAVYDPPLPQVPSEDDATGTFPGMHLSTNAISAGMYNLLNGETDPIQGFEDPRNVRQQLDDILAALAGTSEADQVALLQKIVIALGGTL